MSYVGLEVHSLGDDFEFVLTQEKGPAARITRNRLNTERIVIFLAALLAGVEADQIEYVNVQVKPRVMRVTR